MEIVRPTAAFSLLMQLWSTRRQIGPAKGSWTAEAAAHWMGKISYALSHIKNYRARRLNQNPIHVPVLPDCDETTTR